MVIPRKPKIVVICGPTSSGKSALVLSLARRFHGEIICADSRQVYQRLDIGTSKPTKQEQKLIPHHLIDICPPEHEFSVGEYKKLARQAIASVHRRRHLPFLVGGAGLYLDAVAGGLAIPEISANPELRAKLETKSFAALYTQLRRLDPVLAKTIDRNNKRRLVRALEVCLTTGKPFSTFRKKETSPYNSLWLAIAWPRPQLYQRIDRTIDRMIALGLKKEVVSLIKDGISSTRLLNLGLEYRFISEVVTGRLTEAVAVQKLKFASHQYAKRQLTWFKRNKKIRWLKPAKAENQANQLINTWLKS